MLTVSTILEYLDEFAPRELSAEWDNVGLLLGDRSAAVERVMTCLTVTPDSAAEAIQEGAQLIVTHHPILFRPVKRLTTDTPEGRMLLALARGNVAVYSPHTAFDNVKGGINDIIADRLGLVDVVALRRNQGPRLCKVVVFVPDADLPKVSDALFAGGAGRIGQYSECSFRLAGTGTFFGSDASNPTVGVKGRREEVNEWRLEVICPEPAVESVVAAMRKAHSYEEPAFDVYSLRPGVGSGGAGRIGSLPAEVTLAELAKTVQSALSAKHVDIVGNPATSVRRLALACGAAAEFMHDALAQRADVFLTGEARFHDYLAAQANGLQLVLPGHYATERIGVEALAAKMQEKWPELRIWASRQERDPIS